MCFRVAEVFEMFNNYFRDRTQLYLLVYRLVDHFSTAIIPSVCDVPSVVVSFVLTLKGFGFDQVVILENWDAILPGSSSPIKTNARHTTLLIDSQASASAKKGYRRISIAPLS